MPRLMSFAMTTDQIRTRSKCVTRRFGWDFLKPGDLLQPVEKAMGLKPGEKVQRIGGLIKVVSTRWEPLNVIDQAECVLEGFPDMTPEEFIHMLCTHYRVPRDKLVNRIEFSYVNTRDQSVNESYGYVTHGG